MPGGEARSTSQPDPLLTLMCFGQVSAVSTATPLPDRRGVHLGGGGGDQEGTE